MQPSALIFGRGRAKELLRMREALSALVNEHVTESIRKTTKNAKPTARAIN